MIAQPEPTPILSSQELTAFVAEYESWRYDFQAGHASLVTADEQRELRCEAGAIVTIYRVITL